MLEVQDMKVTKSSRLIISWVLVVLFTSLLLACAGPSPASSKAKVGAAAETATPEETDRPTAVGSQTPTPAPTSTVEIRHPVVADSFYPGDAQRLATMVDTFLGEVEKVGPEPIALVVPHAGYIYSGQVAAYSYKQIEGVDYEAIVVVGNNHRDPGFRDISVWAEGAFETPLGLVPIDTMLAESLIAADERIVFDRDVHLSEHSVEVQLPFLQRIYGDKPFQIVPIIVGEPSEENIQILTRALVGLLAGKKALVIASTDMSHYPAYETACLVDGAALSAVESMDTELVAQTIDDYMGRGLPNLHCVFCGEGPLYAVMLTAHRLGANQATVLKYANSGDTPFGDRQQVVGYGAVMFWRGEESLSTSTPSTPSTPEPTPSEAGSESESALESALMEPIPLNAAEKEELLSMARETIAVFLKAMVAPLYTVTEPNLQRFSGAFVTLKEHGQLRGCIGRMTAASPLYLTVQRVGIEAAVADSRFPPLTSAELDEVEIEISVLSPLQPIDDVGEIEVGRHGVILVKDDKQGVFLPQVAPEQGWDRQEMLANLCFKAGIDNENCWQEGAQFYVFTAEVFAEGE